MVPDSITPEQVNDVVTKYKSGMSILKIEEQTQLMLNSIFDILSSKRILPRVFTDSKYHLQFEPQAIKGYKHFKNTKTQMKAYEIGEVVYIKIDSGDKRVPCEKGKCKIIFKNDSYMTLEMLAGRKKITVTLSDIIEKKATVLKIKGEKVEI